MFNVHELRKAGYGIRITHFRVFPHHELRNTKYITRFDYENDCMLSGPDISYGDAVSPKGGETHIHIATPDGEIVEGRAHCRPDENYNKKLGVRIALGRALHGSNVNEYSR